MIQNTSFSQMTKPPRRIRHGAMSLCTVIEETPPEKRGGFTDLQCISYLQILDEIKGNSMVQDQALHGCIKDQALPIQIQIMNQLPDRFIPVSPGFASRIRASIADVGTVHPTCYLSYNSIELLCNILIKNTMGKIPKKIILTIPSLLIESSL